MTRIESDFDNHSRVFWIHLKNDHGFRIGSVSGTILGDKAHLLGLRVFEQSARRNGHGSKLLGTFTLIALLTGAKSIQGDFRPETGQETETRAFYKKMGFTIDEKNKLYKKL